MNIKCIKCGFIRVDSKNECPYCYKIDSNKNKKFFSTWEGIYLRCNLCDYIYCIDDLDYPILNACPRFDCDATLGETTPYDHPEFNKINYADVNLASAKKLKCQKCGYIYNDLLKACPYCDASNANAKPVADDEPGGVEVQCYRCKRIYQDTQITCPECGSIDYHPTHADERKASPHFDQAPNVKCSRCNFVYPSTFSACPNCPARAIWATGTNAPCTVSELENTVDKELPEDQPSYIENIFVWTLTIIFGLPIIIWTLFVVAFFGFIIFLLLVMVFNV